MKKQLAPSHPAASYDIFRYSLIALFVSAILYLPAQYLANAKSHAGEHTSPNMAQASSTPNPGRIVYVSRPGYTGLSMINVDGTNPISLTDFTDFSVDRPSVSAQTGMIAFQASSINVTPPVDRGDTRIFVMDGDGTGIRQITFAPNPGENAQYTADFNPRISPDGTEVAFISKRKQGTPLHDCNNRFIYGSITEQQEVFVVNTDGTNLRQMTQPEYVDTSVPGNDSWGTCAGSDNYAVAWTSDNQLVIFGTRQYSYTAGGSSGGQDIVPVILTPGGTLYGVNDPGTPENPNTRSTSIYLDGNSKSFFDVAADNNILFAADIVDYVHLNYENRNSIGIWTPGALTPGYVTVQSLMGQSGYGGATDDLPHGGFISNACFSPSGALLLLGKSPLATDYNDHLFIGNGRGMVDNTGPVQGGWGIAWATGPSIPKPDKLVLTPNPLLTYNQQAVQVTPALLDAEGHVIVRAARFHATEGAGFRCDNTPDQIPCSFLQLRDSDIDFTGKVTGTDGALQGNLCAVNGGLRGCVPYYNTTGKAFLSVEATKPVALTSGTDGPGTLTIKREGDTPTKDVLVVNFTLGGTAERDVDYSLDFSGNTIVIPANQDSVDINVRPLRQQSEDKTVILTLQPDPQINYVIASFSSSTATVTIKDDGVASSLSLSAVTPNTGGDEGSVTATIYGTNIQPGASVKLSRNGQTEIVGSAASVTANGLSMTTTFNLTGRERGAWDVIVTNPNSQTAVLAGAFTIQESKGAQVWVNVIGRYTMRSDLTERFYIAYGNSGDVDSDPTMIRIFIPDGLRLKELPVLADGSSPVIQGMDNGMTLVLPLDKIAAASSAYVPLNLTADPAFAHQDVQILAYALSSPGLTELATQPDPTVNYTTEIVTNNPDYKKIVTHFTSASGNFDLPYEIFIEDDTQARPRTFETVEDGDTVQFKTSISVPVISSASAQNAHSMRSAPQQTKYKKVSQVATTTKVELDAENSWGRHVHWIKDYKVYKTNRKLLVDCLIKKGVFDPSLDPVALAKKYEHIGQANFYFHVLTITRLEVPDMWQELGLPGAVGDDWKETLFNASQRLPVTDYPLIAEMMHDIFTPSRTNVPQDLQKIYESREDPYDLSRHQWQEKVFQRLLDRCTCEKVPFTFFSHPLTRGLAEALAPAEPQSCGCASGNCKSAKYAAVVKIVFSTDPNDKVGTQGTGSQHYTSGAVPINYSVFFENKQDATALAQRVVITDQLDTSKLDISTFALGAFSFGDTVVAVPQGLSDYSTDVDLRPAKNLVVRINAQLDKTTGLLTVDFTSLDPGTMQPVTDPLAGFLPPNVTSPEGQGSIIFSVLPQSNLATGDEIRNRARIVFDQNAPIDTAEWLNTIDRTKPQSQVAPLPSTECGNFEVSWSGTDAGAGVASYSVYVSEDGGEYTLWLSDTTDTRTNFTGQAGKSYSFYSVARDGAGNTEDAPASAAATTTITPASITVTAPPDKSFNMEANATTCGLLINSSALGTATASGGCSTLTINISGVPAGNVFPVGTTTITYAAMDANGNTGTAEQKITVVDKTPPKLTLPPDVMAPNSPGSCSATLSIGTATATDNCSGATVQGARQDGLTLTDPYPVGTTTIIWTATDEAGNTAVGLQKVMVKDTELPVISDVFVDKTELWPANHKMVDVTVRYNVMDNCDSESSITRALSVTSSEPSNGTGDGDAAPDWEVLDANHIRLRAERAGNGQGRTYTITITATDRKGNYSSRSMVVKVPKSK